MSRLLHWLIRSICKQGRKGARLCSHGKEAFPSRTDGCLEAQGTSHILQVALWGQRDAPPGVAKPLEMAHTSSWAAAVSLGSTCVCRS